MPTLIPTTEIAIDILLAMLSNPSVDVTDKHLPDIAVNHANTILESLNERAKGQDH